MLENTERAIKKWTIQRNWQHWEHKIQDEDNYLPPSSPKKKKAHTHTAMRKQTQIW